MKMLYYNPMVATAPQSHTVPGMKRFSLYSQKITSGPGVMFLDRTGTIRTPIETASIYPMPQYRPLRDTLEHVCDARAVELLRRAEKLGVRLHLFYSGGIDSTLMLVSILKHADAARRENITVLLTEDSIIENPNFYREHLKGKIALENSSMFDYMLGTKGLFVGAELSDLIFGSDFVRPFMGQYGLEGVLGRYNRDKVITHFTEKLGDTLNAENEARFIVEIMERLRAKAPVPLVSHLDFFWWVSFCTKWQFIAVRMLAFTAARNAKLITPLYVDNHYSHFFDTELFQLWSMNNLDKRIKNDWKTYKWPCKDIIYDYTKDAGYRDTKTKRGSLGIILTQQNPFHYIDESFGLHRHLPIADYTNRDNDFVDR